MARVLKGSHSFTCTSTHSSVIGMSHTCLCLPSYSWYSFTDPEGRKDELAWVAGYVVRQFTCLKAVTHPITNRARCRATVLIETNALPLHFYRQDCRVAANCRYCFYSQAKNQVFRPGRLVAPIQVKLCTTDGHLGPLGCAKFHVNRNRCGGVGMRPQKYQKFPLFGKESPRRGDSLGRFRNFFRAFIRLTILR